MFASSEKNKKSLINFVTFIIKKCVKAIFSVKTKKITKPKKEHTYLKRFFKLFLNFYIGLISMGQPEDKRKAATDSRFVG